MESSKGQNRVKSRVKSVKTDPKKGSSRVKTPPDEPTSSIDLPIGKDVGQARRRMDPMNPTELHQIQTAQTHVTAALEQLRNLGVRMAAEAKSFLQAASATLGGTATVDAIRDPERFRAFAGLMRQRRRAADLSQEELALRAKISKTTVKNIEMLRQKPSRKTVARLLSVQAMGLQVDDVSGPKPNNDSFSPNSWFSPEYDPVRLGLELVRMVNSPSGGHLEQTYQYLDAQSAAAWITLANSGRYAQAYRAACPLDRVAARAAQIVKPSAVDVIALGSGDGRAEVRFTQHLLDQLPAGSQLRLKLLDISHALLGTAYRHAVDLLEPREVQIHTLHADFHHLVRYPELHYRPTGAPPRPRIFLLLGNTLANVDNELRFFQQLHESAVAGDLVVVDCQLAAAPADRPDEIRRLDGTIREGKPSPEHAAWLSGPFRRHGRDVADVQISVELRQQCAVPGSYEADLVATVRGSDGSVRRFSSWRGRRYDPERLAACLRELGWEKELLLRYGPDGKEAAAVMLLRRAG